MKARSGLTKAGYAAIAVVLIAVVAGAGYYAVSVPPPTPSTTTVISTTTAIRTTTATTTLTTSSTTTPKTLKVALIVEGPKLDGSYNQLIYTDFLSVVNSSKGLITGTSVDNVGPSDVQRVASSLAQQGYNLIIGNGFDLSAGMATVAKQFPNTYFAMYGGGILGSNVESFNIWGNEAGYVAGYLAAYMSKTGKVGDVLAYKYSIQLDWSNGFMLGAKQAAQELKKSLTVTNAWTNTWTDPSTGLQAANSMLSSGVDVIGEYASGPGSGMQQAIKQAYKNSTNGPFALGAFLNQNDLGAFMIGSNVWNFKPVIEQLVARALSGTFGGKIYNYYLRDGVSSIIMSNSVPQNIQTKVRWLQGNVTSGQVVVPLEISTDLMPTGTITVP